MNEKVQAVAENVTNVVKQDGVKSMIEGFGWLGVTTVLLLMTSENALNLPSCGGPIAIGGMLRVMFLFAGLKSYDKQGKTWLEKVNDHLSKSNTQS